MTGQVAKKRVAILISGRGSNMERLFDAAQDPNYPASIVGVISNRQQAQGLDFARVRDIPTFVGSIAQFGDREHADRAIDAKLREWNADIVCLAGFMRILTPQIVENWRGRMINIHPSLLPRHKGLDTHQRAIDAGDAEHGCTVHFVVPELDAGPTIAQAKVAITSNDTAETLASRVLVQEHDLYPKALAMVARGEALLPDSSN